MPHPVLSLVGVFGMVVLVCAMAGAADIHQTGNYPSRTTPAPGVGQFHLNHDPDRLILGYYGGVGLHKGEDGRWTDFFITSKTDVDYLIARCREFGMNRIYANIMFQQTQSQLLGPPPGTPTQDSAGLFGYAVEQAHANNIQVYADVPVFGRRPRDEPFVRANSDDIFARRQEGGVNDHFFSPANPKVRAYRIAVLLEVLSHYPVDGIQLDFIRWETDVRQIPDLEHTYSNYGYRESFLKEFRQNYNLPADYMPKPDDPRFVRMRADCVTLFIDQLRAALQRSGVSLPIGVYNSNIYGREASLHNVCQDWKTWEDRGLVDEHHPMFYMDDLSRLTGSLQSLLDVKRKESIVFGPIFLDGPGDFSPENIKKTAQRMIQIGCDGIWFCREMELEQKGLWPAVKQISELSLSDLQGKK